MFIVGKINVLDEGFVLRLSFSFGDDPSPPSHTHQNKTAKYANRCYVICKYRLFVFGRVEKCMW